MSYPLYIVFGVLPSIVWLLFYLRKDAHPESNSQILRIFFYGVMAAAIAGLLEITVFKIFGGLDINQVSLILLKTFIGVALIEEFLKYLVVRYGVLKTSALDEPIDVMLYMIIAALGFAALENILILLPLGPDLFLGRALEISTFRLLGATFLHTLASGTAGYFLALSIFERKGRIWLLALGLFLAIFFHGLYNFSIANPDLISRFLSPIIEIGKEELLRFFIPVIILFGLAIFVSLGFKRLKGLKSVCQIR